VKEEKRRCLLTFVSRRVSGINTTTRKKDLSRR